MRREGVVLLLAGWVMTIFILNIETVGNMIFMFLLAGVVPGTRVVFSSGMMFFLSLSSLLFMILWMVRTKLMTHPMPRPENAAPSRAYLKRRRFKYIEVS